MLNLINSCILKSTFCLIYIEVIKQIQRKDTPFLLDFWISFEAPAPVWSLSGLHRLDKGEIPLFDIRLTFVLSSV